MKRDGSMKTWMKSTCASVCCLNTQRCSWVTGCSKPEADLWHFMWGYVDMGGGASAAQVWLWMSAGGAFILLPRGWNITGGHDPRVVPHSEILHLLAVWKPTIHPDSWVDPEAFKSRMTRWHGIVNGTLMGLTVVYMLSRTAWCSKGQGYSTNLKRFL